MADTYMPLSAAIEYLMTNMCWQDDDGYLVDDADEKREAIKNLLDGVPPADVVARDCYNNILAENDTMREMLAQVGKKPGDKMDDLRPVVRGEWISKGFMTVKCSNCDECFHELEGDNFCPNCGADMRETGR